MYYGFRVFRCAMRALLVCTVFAAACFTGTDRSEAVEFASVSGVVTDAVTGAPVSSAEMWLQGDLGDGGDPWDDLGGPIYADAAGRYQFGILLDREYRVCALKPGYRNLYSDPISSSGADLTYDIEIIPLNRTKRLAGANRFTTAVEIAREGYETRFDQGNWPGVDDIVLACGDDAGAADALSAAGLCGLYDAPLFLVSTDYTPREVITAVKEIASVNGDVTVHIVGGPARVPEARLWNLDAGSGRLIMDRIQSTGDRYDTAAAIARRIIEETGEKPELVLVANGADPSKFADALALSPLSRAMKAPILLVGQDHMPDATDEAIRDCYSFLPQTAYVVAGGPATIGEDLYWEHFGSRVAMDDERWAGADRYGTAIAIADKAIEHGWLSSERVGLAANLPDALAGGGMLGRARAPLLLTRGETLTRSTGSWLSDNRSSILQCYLFGGTRSISDSVKAQVSGKLQ